MIAGLKAYPEYKATGLPWLNDLAAGWRILRGKIVFSAVDVRSKTGKEELLTVSASNGVRPRSQQSVTMFMAKSYVGHKLCWPGDLVVNSLWAWMQGLGVAHHHGLISSAYSVYRGRREFTDYSRFFHYLLRSAAYKWELQTRSKGVWTSRLQLLDQAFMDMPIVLPKPDEQAAIVRFLDHGNWRIEEAIQVKKKLIALLNEQRQAIIHRAVTRGLDPDVELKPSGIPWLGDIPHHWDARKVKQCTTRIEQGWSPQCDAQPAAEGEWGVMKVGCVNKDQFNATQNKRLPLSLPPDLALEIRDGDILVSRANTPELLGLAALAENPRRKLILCDKLFRFRALSTCFHPRFLVYALRCKPSRAQIESSTNGASSSMQNIGQGVLKNLWVAMPPIKEQIDIVAAVFEQTRPLDTAIHRTEREIGLLREYRTRLIADVVTGKLDVREAVRQLPATPEEMPVAGNDEELEEEAIA